MSADTGPLSTDLIGQRCQRSVWLRILLLLPAMLLLPAGAALRFVPALQHQALEPFVPPADRARFAIDLKRGDFWDGSLLRAWENREAAVAPVRRPLVHVASVCEWAIFGELGTGVRQGREGWLFLESSCDPHVAPPDAVHRGIALTAELSRVVEARGVQLWILPVPPRPLLARPFIEDDVRDLRAPYERLIAGLEAAHVRVIDVLPRWDRDLGPDAFIRTDTHWSPEGSRIVCEEIAKATGVWVPQADRKLKLGELKPRTYAGDLLRYVGVIQGRLERPTLERHLLRAGGRLEDSSLSMLVRSPPSPSVDFNPDKARLVTCGTSFSETLYFKEYADHFSNGRIRVEARAGGRLLGSLAPRIASLIRGNRPWPDIWVWEFSAIHLLENDDELDTLIPAIQRLKK